MQVRLALLYSLGISAVVVIEVGIIWISKVLFHFHIGAVLVHVSPIGNLFRTAQLAVNNQTAVISSFLQYVVVCKTVFKKRGGVPQP